MQKRNGTKKDKPRISMELIFFVLFVMSFLLLGWFVIRLLNSTKDQIKSELEIEMARLERSLTDKIDHTFSIIKSINLQIAENPRSDKHINEILKVYRTNPSLTDTFSWTIFSWVDDNYQITVDANYGILKTPIDISTCDCLLLTEKDPGTFKLGAPRIGTTSKKWVIPGAVGVNDENGLYLGATTIGFDIETMAKLLQKVLQNHDVKFTLFGKNEVPILYADIKEYGIDKSNDDSLHVAHISKILNEINSEKSDKVFEINLFQDRHAFLVKKVANYPYILFLTFNKKSIGKELLYITASRLTEILSIIMSLGILLILIYREKKQTLRILRLKLAAENANNEKTGFLTKAAHEFKNFVFGIQGCSEIIRTDLRTMITELKLDHVEKSKLSRLETDLDLSNNIIEASHDLDNFINDLLELNRAEIGEFKIKKSVKPINIAKIIKQAVLLSKKRAKNSEIILVSTIDSDLHSLSNLDPLRMKQMVMRLIFNAVKYSPGGSVVEVIAKNITDKNEIKKISNLSGSKKTKAVEITVKDQGYGMSENEVKEALQKRNFKNHKNFDPFGLSLPLIKYLVERQNGIFEIRSQKNKGSEIRIIF